MRTRIVRTLIGATSALLLVSSCNQVLGANVAGAPAAAAPAPATAAAVPAVAQEILNDVNAERSSRGLPALKWNPQLADVAAQWNQNMNNTGAFQHRNLNLLFDDPAFGHYGGLGENIFKGSGASFSSGAIHVAWMRSDGHRKNVLSPGFDSIGISVLCVNGTTWATQNFGRESGSKLPTIGTGGTPPVDPIVTPSEGGSTC